MLPKWMSHIMATLERCTAVICIFQVSVCGRVQEHIFIYLFILLRSISPGGIYLLWAHGWSWLKQTWAQCLSGQLLVREVSTPCSLYGIENKSHVMEMSPSFIVRLIQSSSTKEGKAGLEGKIGQDGEKQRPHAHVGVLRASWLLLTSFCNIKTWVKNLVLCIYEVKSALVMMMDCICSLAQRTFNPPLRSHAGRLRQMKINYRTLLLSQSFIYSVRCWPACSGFY